MRIQHNIMAMNSYRNYTNNANSLSKNLEKLSSGYKINRAGDDAAGLAISEKMRAQIQGLNAAQKNVKDGISLVKTAEGAMQEIQDMLSRMKYLATQSANGTYDNDVDRAALQDEVDSLRAEINRIAKSANFNGTNLLDGGASAGDDDSEDIVSSTLYSSATTVNTADITSSNAADLKTSFGSDSNIGINVTGSSAIKSIVIKVVAGSSSTADATVAASVAGTTLTITIKQAGSNGTAFSGNVVDLINAAIGSTVGVTVTGSIDLDTVNGSDAQTAAAGISITVNSETSKVPSDYGIASIDVSGAKGVTDGANISVAFASDGTLTVSIGTVEYTYTATGSASALAGQTITLDGGDNGSITVTLGSAQTVIGAGEASIAAGIIGTVSVEEAGGGGGGGGYVSVQLQIGDDSAGHNKLKFNIGDMHVSAMGKFERDVDSDGNTIYKLKGDKLEKGDNKGEAATIENISIESIDEANEALDVIKEAINYVSAVRGNLGAIQNRLEHTQNNLSVMAENIQDAESTIRDTDVADEMMGYVKNNILIQSAQAMLAQANQVPQGVLQLLG